MITRVDAKRRQLHVAGEVAALAVMVPFLVHVSRTHPSSTTRTLALAAAGATLVVDGYLLFRWLR